MTRRGLIVHGWYDTTRRSRIRRSYDTTGGGAALRGNGRGAHLSSHTGNRFHQKYHTLYATHTIVHSFARG
eukprot:1414633-Prymnesium_polylepis.1